MGELPVMQFPYIAYLRIREFLITHVSHPYILSEGENPFIHFRLKIDMKLF